MGNELLAANHLESVCSRMISARWLDHYRAVGHGGVAIAWSELGNSRKAMLFHAIENLSRDHESTDSFDFLKLSRRSNGSGMTNFEHGARSFWLACMDELGIDMAPQSLEAFVQVLCATETESSDCLVISTPSAKASQFPRKIGISETT